MMIQTIIVFLIFFGVIAYYGVKFFRKDKHVDKGGHCSKCASGKISSDVKQ